MKSRPAYLTWEQFKIGCQSYLNIHRSSSVAQGSDGRSDDGQYLGPGLYAQGWTWEEHSMVGRGHQRGHSP